MQQLQRRRRIGPPFVDELPPSLPDPVDTSRDEDEVLRRKYEISRPTMLIAGNEQAEEDGVLLEGCYHVDVALHRAEEVDRGNLVVVGRQRVLS